MAQLPWIQGFLFIILQLTVTAERTSVIKRAGDEAMLSCSELIDGQQKCNRTTWTFTASRNSSLVELVTVGHIKSSKADRLSLTSDCYLVIKEVREEDAGRYYCQQWNMRGKQTAFHQFAVDLSVLCMNKQEDQSVTLNCSVVTYDPCPYKVQWFDQDVTNKESPSESVCSATVTLSSGFKFPQCKVTQSGSDEEFTFSLQPSATNKATNGSRDYPASVSTKVKIEKDVINKAPFITVAVVSGIVLITAVVTIIWRAKGKKTKTGENAVEPEDVYYSTIKHPEGTNRRALVVQHDTVTYSTLAACSSSAAAADDPNKPYSFITSIN